MRFFGLFRRRPVEYGTAIALTPKAIAEDPDVFYEAVDRLFRNFADTDVALKQKGKRGLDPSTLRIYRVEPIHECLGVLTDGEPGTEGCNTVLGWKASSR